MSNDNSMYVGVTREEAAEAKKALDSTSENLQGKTGVTVRAAERNRLILTDSGEAITPAMGGSWATDDSNRKSMYESVSAEEVRGYAWQFPGVRLQTTLALEKTESGTRLVERVCVEAPRILRRFVVRRARRAHEETLARMKALFEQPGG